MVLYPEGVKADDQADVATFAGMRLIEAKKALQVDCAIVRSETACIAPRLSRVKVETRIGAAGKAAQSGS